MEQGIKNNIEAEIAELASQIEAKRKILESERGMVEEREIVRQAVGEKMSQNIPTFSISGQTKTGSQTSTDIRKSYLDSVPPEVEAEVNGLLAIVFEKGVEGAIKIASKSSPLVMDAFHDALTDKLYNDLKDKGILK